MGISVHGLPSAGGKVVICQAQEIERQPWICPEPENLAGEIPVSRQMDGGSGSEGLTEYGCGRFACSKALQGIVPPIQCRGGAGDFGG